jgi:RimJ/RimL family protein N-acetyltransferase
VILCETERLLIRDFVPEDVPAVYEWCSDPEAMRFVLAGGAWTEERSRNYVEGAIAEARQEPRTNFALAILLREQERLIGGCRLTVVSSEHREGHIGYGLDRRFWGQGYATEAIHALLSFGFITLGLHRISSDAIAENIASVRVLEKVGMALEGRIREKYWLEARWWDSVIYGLLEHEWREQFP